MSQSHELDINLLHGGELTYQMFKCRPACYRIFHSESCCLVMSLRCRAKEEDLGYRLNIYLCDQESILTLLPSGEEVFL